MCDPGVAASQPPVSFVGGTCGSARLIVRTNLPGNAITFDRVHTGHEKLTV